MPGKPDWEKLIAHKLGLFTWESIGEEIYKLGIQEGLLRGAAIASKCECGDGYGCGCTDTLPESIKNEARMIAEGLG